jgi:hypothetical protein
MTDGFTRIPAAVHSEYIQEHITVVLIRQWGLSTIMEDSRVKRKKLQRNWGLG